MSLKDRLQKDMITALKSHDALKVSVIRLAKAAIINSEIARGHPLEDNEVLEALAKEAKQRHDAIPEYEKAERPDIVAALRQELAILQKYLPEQMSEVELRDIIAATIAEVGVSSKQELGKVMGALMPKVKGRADGKLVNQIVNSLLE
jgi:uncharacterized protein YqeY